MAGLGGADWVALETEPSARDDAGDGAGLIVGIVIDECDGVAFGFSDGFDAGDEDALIVGEFLGLENARWKQ